MASAIGTRRMSFNFLQSNNVEKSPNRNYEVEGLKVKYDELCKNFKNLNAALKKRHESLIQTATSRVAVAEAFSAMSEESPASYATKANDTAMVESRKKDLDRANEFSSSVMDYFTLWQNTVTARINADYKMTDQLRRDADHYTDKVTSLKTQIDKLQSQAKPVPQDKTEKLQRNEQKHQEAVGAYHRSAKHLILVMEELVDRSWRDLHPLILKLLQFDLDHHFDESESLRDLQRAVDDLHHLQEDNQIPPDNRFNDIQKAKPHELTTGAPSTRDRVPQPYATSNEPNKYENVARRSPQSSPKGNNHKKNNRNRDRDDEDDHRPAMPQAPPPVYRDNDDDDDDDDDRHNSYTADDAPSSPWPPKKEQASSSPWPEDEAPSYERPYDEQRPHVLPDRDPQPYDIKMTPDSPDSSFHDPDDGPPPAMATSSDSDDRTAQPYSNNNNNDNGYSMYDIDGDDDDDDFQNRNNDYDNTPNDYDNQYDNDNNNNGQAYNHDNNPRYSNEREYDEDSFNSGSGNDDHADRRHNDYDDNNGHDNWQGFGNNDNDGQDYDNGDNGQGFGHDNGFDNHGFGNNNTNGFDNDGQGFGNNNDGFDNDFGPDEEGGAARNMGHESSESGPGRMPWRPPRASGKGTKRSDGDSPGKTSHEEYEAADPEKWKVTKETFSGGFAYVTLGETEERLGSIKKGKKEFKKNPEKYSVMVYQTDMLDWPLEHQRYNYVHRAGTKGYVPTGTGQGHMTVLTQTYERLPPMENNDLPMEFRDEYTDHMSHRGYRLHSDKNKPLLPGRGMGVGDAPDLKIIGDVDPSDIHQGSVGNCWLLSGISCLAEFDGAVKHLFRKTERLHERPLPEPNQYIITLWDLETWTEKDIVMDERLAAKADGSGQLLGTTPSEDGELWVCYLEKALAIHCGGWDKITGGQCTHAWALMTGCKQQYTIRINKDTGLFACYGKYNPNTRQHSKLANSPHDGEKNMWPNPWPEAGGGGDMTQELTEEELFMKMCAWDDVNFIIGAACTGKSGDAGLVDNHAYSVLECHNDVAGTDVDLIKVRNPWGKGEIEDGEFDDDGPGWDQYPQIKAELKPVVADDGIFWVTKQEFFRFFSTVYLSASNMTEFLED